MAKLKMTASVVSQAQLAEGIYDLRLKAPEIASQAAAGQFVSVYSKDGSRLLPRPISLCGIDNSPLYLFLRCNIYIFLSKCPTGKQTIYHKKETPSKA